MTFNINPLPGFGISIKITEEKSPPPPKFQVISQKISSFYKENPYVAYALIGIAVVGTLEIYLKQKDSLQTGSDKNSWIEVESWLNETAPPCSENKNNQKQGIYSAGQQ